jgi:hypothetical protein
MGDLTSLADSIRQEGLLQPIGVTDRLELVFGERRIRAVRDTLKKETILARIVDVSSIIAGEYAENEVRKDFTPSERVAIAKEIERQIGKRRGQRTDKQLVEKTPQVPPGKKTREAAAEKAGFGNDRTYRRATNVIESGAPRLIQAMDEGLVSISHGAKGPGHFALGIEADALDAWRRKLQENGVVIEQEVEWPWGGKSIYVKATGQQWTTLDKLRLTTGSTSASCTATPITFAPCFGHRADRRCRGAVRVRPGLQGVLGNGDRAGWQGGGEAVRGKVFEGDWKVTRSVNERGQYLGYGLCKADSG